MEINRKLINVIPETPRIVAKEVLHVYAVANPVLQSLGDSTVFAMSQKAVTDAILSLIGVVNYDTIENTPIKRVTALPVNPTAKYYQYVGSNTKDYVYNGIYCYDGSTYSLVGSSNLENGSGIGSIQQKQYAIDGTIYKCTASGRGSFAFGQDCVASGKLSTSIGHTNTAVGNSAFVSGQVNIGNGDGSFTTGNGNINDGTYAFMAGQYGRNNSYASAMFGLSNSISGDAHDGKGCNIVAGKLNNIYSSDYNAVFGTVNNLTGGSGNFVTGEANVNESGQYNAIVGYKNTNRGQMMLIAGANNIIEKNTNCNIIAGQLNKVYEGVQNSFVAGAGNEVKGRYMTVLGSYNKATAGGTQEWITLIGQGLTPAVKNQTIFGFYNKPTVAKFVIGNGTSDSDRKNIFEVFSDGRAKVYAEPIDDNDVLRKGDIKNLDISGGSGNSGIPTVYKAGDGISIVGDTISTKLKTVNGQSLPGDGNIDIDLNIHAADYYGSAVVEKTTKTLFLNDDLFGRNKEKLSKLVINGDGKSFLANDGTYKEFTVNNDSKIVVDTVLSSNSTNAIANAAVYHKFSEYVPKQTGKQLSTEDFTTAFKTKLQNAKIYVDIATSTLKIRL